MTRHRAGYFAGKSVLIIGASGGLGRAFAKAFAAEGAVVLLAARRPEVLELLRQELNAPGVYDVDLTKAESIRALVDQIQADRPTLSMIVNATGYDVRKPLDAHNTDEIDQSLAVNLRGSILLTHAFLPILQQHGDGVILHMGGFADGRLAFPFYAVDFATRAGLRGFVDSVNREIAGSGVTVCYFSPNPADTEAERPFHPLWRQMGQSIVTPEAVAQALLNAAIQKRTVYIMGGPLTRLFSTLNTVAPRLADVLLMNRYRHLMADFFDVRLPVRKPAQSASLRTIGIVLIALSFVLYGIGLLVLPFTSLELSAKAGLVPVSLLFGELSFWVGAAIVGGEVVTRYRKCLNPCNWGIGRRQRC